MKHVIVGVVAVVVVVVLVAGTGCASAPPAQTWDTVDQAPVQRMKSGPAEKAAAQFTDDQCVATADELLRAKDPDADEYMRACLHRDDFLLLDVLNAERWRHLDIKRDDWQAVLRAQIRRGNIDTLSMKRYGIIDLDPEKLVDQKKPPPATTYLLQVEVVRPDSVGGKRGAHVKRIVFEDAAGDKVKRETFDVVTEDNSGRILGVERDKEIVTEKQHVVRSVAHTENDSVWIELDGDTNLRVGERYALIVDGVSVKNDSTKGVFVIRAHALMTASHRAQ
jgi:hypothetical protein